MGALSGSNTTCESGGISPDLGAIGADAGWGITLKKRGELRKETAGAISMGDSLIVWMLSVAVSLTTCLAGCNTELYSQ